MKKPNRVATISALTLIAVLATGCAGNGGNGGDGSNGGNGDPTGEAPESAVLGCMVTNSGGLEDRSFNQSTWAGLEKAKAELGITTKVLVSESPTDLVPNVQTMVQEQCDLIVTVGWELWDATEEAAKANSEIAFAIVDEVLDQTNVRSIVFDTAQASFLAGYLAAGMSETGIVATFGGDAQPPVTLFMDGFADGVTHYNKVNNAGVHLLGWDKNDPKKGLFTGDYENIANGKTLTENLIAQGADVIMPVAGQVGEGAAAAILDAGKGYVIWVDSDGYETAPADYKPIMLTSVLKRMDDAVFQTVEDLEGGVFSNEMYVGTLENGGVDLASFHDVRVPAALQLEIEELRKQIISGELVIHSDNAPRK